MKALIWKEWREQRIFLFILIGILLSFRIVNFVLLKTITDYLNFLETRDFYYFIFGWIIIPLFFALILGALPFVKEFSNNTQDFLLQKPITTAKIFWLKFFFGLSLLLFITVLSRLVLHIPTSLISRELSYTNQHLFTIYYLPFIIVYSAVFFSSLLIKRELPAILFSPFIIIFGTLLISPLYLILFIILPSKFLPFIFSEKVIFIFSACILIAVFLLYSFLIWQKAISKGLKSTKIVVSITGTIFLLCLVPHTILNLLSGWELTKTINQAKANGIKLTLEEIIPPAVPKEENAAFIYQEAFDLADKLKEKYKDEWKYMLYKDMYYSSKVKLEELTPEQKKTINQLLLENAEFIKLYTLIEKAVNSPACRFDVKYEDWPATELRYINKMRPLAKLVSERTYILTEEKRYKEALNSAHIGLKLGESLKNEPTLLSQLVRISLDGIATKSFQPIMSIFPEEISINNYQQLISEINKKEREITKGLESELVMTKSIFDKLLSGNLKTLMEEGEIPFYYRIYASYLARPLLKQDYAFYIRYFTESINVSQLPYYQAKSRLLKLEKDAEYGAMKYHLLSSILLPSITAIQVRQAEDNARLDGLKIASALKIYKKKNGDYPDTLTELMPSIIPELPLDPFTGENFIYRKENEGFIVYSLGPNEKDDGGISQKENTERAEKKDYNKEAYDIVWKCEE